MINHTKPAFDISILDTTPHINIGIHNLNTSITGPQRLIQNDRLQAAVIIEAGLGSGLSEWVSVQRLLSAKTKVVSYDRAEYGASETSPDEPTGRESRERIIQTTRCS